MSFSFRLIVGLLAKTLSFSYLYFVVLPLLMKYVWLNFVSYALTRIYLFANSKS